jgi:hypothetical protein
MPRLSPRRISTAARLSPSWPGSPGGGSTSRVLARISAATSWQQPTVVVQNMARRGSLTAVHYLDLSAAKDGTILDIFQFRQYR